MPHPETIDRFTIVRQVGTGGMGTVYEAIDPDIDRRVALKVLRREVLNHTPELLKRLWVEARAANSIRHPGVVQVSEARLLDDGTGFLVMEFLDGQTLTQRLRQSGGRLPLAEGLQIAIQMASTLLAGHKKGIVHRDLKPDNVMLVPDDAVAGGERVKLLDFGIAKIISEVGVSGPLTLDDRGLGTPGYMAPEQMRDAAHASDRSDTYGLGAVLFEILAGRRPHVAPNAAELIVMVLSQDAPLLKDLLSDAPPALSALLAQMLLREPASARPTVAEVLRELVQISAGLSVPAPALSGPFHSILSPAILSPALVSPRSSPVAAPLASPGLSAIAAAAAHSSVDALHALDPWLAGNKPVADVSEITPTLARMPTERPGPPLLPSASTISQLSGQTELPGFQRTALRRRLGVSAGMLLLVALLPGLVYWMHLRKLASAPPLPAAPPAPAASFAADLKSKADKGAMVVSPLTAEESGELPAVAPAPSGNRRLPPNVACIRGEGLTLAVRRSIATVLSKAGVRLSPGEEIYLLRQGRSLEVDTMPSSATRKQVFDVSRMLGTALGKDALPETLQGVHVRCSGK